MKTGITFLLAFLGTAFGSFGYPISPRPLRLLVEESEFVVMAHVREIREAKSKKESFDGGAEAILFLREVLRGKIRDSVISVSFQPLMICPAPAHFEKGTDVIVFLDRRGKQFFVHALSYGVKTVTPEVAALYKDRIREMQTILGISDKDEQFLQTTEWLVKCAEHEATRYEGTYDLSRASNFMSYYDRSEGKPFQYILNDDQKRRLKKALLSAAEFSYSDFGLIDLVYASNAEEIYRFMVEKVQHLDEKQMWFAGELMKRICQFKSSPRSEELAAAYNEKLYGSGTKPVELKQIITEFLQQVEKIR